MQDVQDVEELSRPLPTHKDIEQEGSATFIESSLAQSEIISKREPKAKPSQ